MNTNNELIERWYHEMWNNWDKTIFSEILHPQFTFRGSLGEEMQGHEALANYMDRIQSAFPDFHNKIQLILTEGDQSFAKLRYTGTHEGMLFGLKATHRPIAYSGAAVFSFYEHKINEVWVLGDVHNLIQQLK